MQADLELQLYIFLILFFKTINLILLYKLLDTWMFEHS